MGSSAWYECDICASSLNQTMKNAMCCGAICDDSDEATFEPVTRFKDRYRTVWGCVDSLKLASSISPGWRYQLHPLDLRIDSPNVINLIRCSYSGLTQGIISTSWLKIWWVSRASHPTSTVDSSVSSCTKEFCTIEFIRFSLTIWYTSYFKSKQNLIAGIVNIFERS